MLESGWDHVRNLSGGLMNFDQCLSAANTVKPMSRTWVFLVVCSFFGCEPRLFAQSTPASAPANANLSEALPTPTPAAVMEKKPELQWSGDLRYRFAQIKEAQDEPRPLQQLRARLQLKTNVNAELKALLRLATASSAISTNQTLGDSGDPGFARRSFGIDLAAMIWSPEEHTQISLGRVPNPYFSPAKTQLIFDSDLNFEGLSIQHDLKLEPHRFFVNAGAFVIAENYDSTTRSDVVDVGIAGLQAGYSHDWGPLQTSFHLASQHYLNIQDLPITSLEKTAKYDIYSNPFDRYRGNTIYTLNPGNPPYQMRNKYVLQEVGFELLSKISLFDVSLFADLVKNTEASREGGGHEWGLAVKWGRTQLGWAQIRKEADAVVGMFTDSDANGGGTDNQGQRLSLAYQFSKNSMVGINQYNAKRGIGSTERDYSLSQVDFMMNF